ncbi:hypothetical protein EOL94_03215 [bacterium]|nr:hypothetical protein [bacterium]
MNKNLKKKLLSLAIVTVICLPVFIIGVNNAHALDTGLNEINDTIQLGSDDPRTIAARIINTAMMFLGLIAVVIILLGGFKWMTAGGSEDKVSEAKKLMGQGVIGLLIVLASWGIAQFVVNQLVNATNNV